MPISRRQIIDSIHDGALAWSQRPSKKRYEHDLVEEIAEQLCGYINNSSGESIVYGNQYYGNRELTFRELRQLSGIYAEPGRDDNQRMDISLLDRKGRPTCIIEVKTHWTRHGSYNDLKRIRELVHECSLRYGFHAVGCLDMREERINQIREEIVDYIDSFGGAKIKHEKRMLSLSIEISAQRMLSLDALRNWCLSVVR